MFKRTLCLSVLLAWPAAADMSDEANACIDELRARYGDVGGEVLKQSGSEAGTLVVLRDGSGAEYECVVWSGPEVAELRRVDADGSGSSSGDGTSASAASGTQRIEFDAGTSGTAMTATLNQNTSVRYVLGANDGQFLNVDVGSHGGALDYKIENPDGSMLLDLISSDTPYKGQLWQSGDHVIEILNAGAQPVTFDVGIGIN
ncbi:hypothetical protein CLV78_107202 [Aliiruegeria haliotis]|uniref:Uncharacterized protein n=2 Tax=Aliiruegeria haliotis TaxID=1280846 RepID=A0A2T0RM90_9RHOB|nr:hypothetical protein CLV78_107202 [Aliiruegeria haliotis]